MGRALASAATLLVALALVGCASPAAPPAVTETVTETASAAPSEVMAAGDCLGDPDSDPAVTYTVWADDTATPVEISYTAFNQDGTTAVETETVTGPIAVRIGYVCNAATSGDIWTLTASTQGSSLSCMLAYGGFPVHSDSYYDEGGPDATGTVDCSGNSGR